MLARLAAEVDPHVRLVTTVIMSPVYHPVLLAEELASLDVMTEGRLVVGIGLGYRPEEFDYLGVPFGERVQRFEEGLELMKAVWTQPSVTFAGRFWQLSGAEPHIQSWQSPHPPVWIGAHAPVAVRRAGRMADEWIVPPAVDLADVGPLLEQFFRRAGPPAASPRAAAATAQRVPRRRPARRAWSGSCGRRPPLPALRAQRPRAVAARRGGA